MGRRWLRGVSLGGRDRGIGPISDPLPPSFFILGKLPDLSIWPKTETLVARRFSIFVQVVHSLAQLGEVLLFSLCAPRAAPDPRGLWVIFLLCLKEFRLESPSIKDAPKCDFEQSRAIRLGLSKALNTDWLGGKANLGTEFFDVIAVLFRIIHVDQDYVTLDFFFTENSLNR